MPTRVPLLTLKVHVPDGEDRSVDLTEWRTVIGRSSKSDLKIVSKQVSKLHAAIEVNDGMAFVRDLGSRNGIEVNGQTVLRARQLNAGDVLLLGDVRITVDPRSLVFRPPESQSALHSLLAEEAALRADSQAEAVPRGSSGHTVNEDFQPTRQAAVLVGRPLGTSSGDEPVLRTLRLADDLGPRDVARIEPFILELERGEQVWIRPNGDVDVNHLRAFHPAPNVWVDEPEDFSGGAGAAIIARDMFFLPEIVKVIGCYEIGRTPDGRRIFSETNPAEPMTISPFDT